MAKKRRTPRKARPAAAAPRRSAPHRPIPTLLHELHVYSEEITVQNEQLIKAQHELEEARDRYADLYDFAPIGYLTVDDLGEIREVNLAAASLFGRPRHFIIGLPFATLIAREQRDALRDFIHRARHATAPPPPVEVRIKHDPHRVVHLVARPLQAAAARQLFIAMVDVTEERRLEADRSSALAREQKKSTQLQAEVGVRLAAEERVKALLERLVDVQEGERRRLAQNLHDHLGQQLTALRLAIDAAKAAAPGSAAAQQRFELIDRLVSQLDRDVDFLAWELRPAALDDVGLEPALQEFLRQWSLTQGVPVEFHASPSNDARLPADVESHLYRIVQEAMHNVSKHARATHVSVLLERRGDEVKLIVEDDGLGFDPDAARGSTKSQGMGLIGMQERAASLGGHLECESASGKGTTLFVRIPVQVSAPRRRSEIGRDNA
jgi:PAS domain S-box-containing protein